MDQIDHITTLEKCLTNFAGTDRKAVMRPEEPTEAIPKCYNLQNPGLVVSRSTEIDSLTVARPIEHLVLPSRSAQNAPAEWNLIPKAAGPCLENSIRIQNIEGISATTSNMSEVGNSDTTSIECTCGSDNRYMCAECYRACCSNCVLNLHSNTCYAKTTILISEYANSILKRTSIANQAVDDLFCQTIQIRAIIAPLLKIQFNEVCKEVSNERLKQLQVDIKYAEVSVEKIKYYYVSATAKAIKNTLNLTKIELEIEQLRAIIANEFAGCLTKVSNNFAYADPITALNQTSDYPQFAINWLLLYGPVSANSLNLKQTVVIDQINKEIQVIKGIIQNQDQTQNRRNRLGSVIQDRMLWIGFIVCYSLCVIYNQLISIISKIFN